jgi:Acetyltransferase (GNAT) domain
MEPELKNDGSGKKTAPGAHRAAGYAHEKYASSLAEYGQPRYLASSGSWILEREIPGSTYRDAMGCYPLFLCRDWARLCDDLPQVGSDLVSLALVTDPFADLDLDQLRTCFNRVQSFKKHFIVDVSRKIEARTSRHHRYYARKALRHVVVEKCDKPEQHLDDWLRLYEALVSRHGLTGITEFSPTSFREQLAVPGAVMFRAIRDGMTVAAHIWYVHNSVAYSHLQATNEKGYEVRATYALYSQALDWFANSLSFADLGSGPGAETKEGDNGLIEFKRGWATGTLESYFCGRIFDRAAYEELTAQRAPSQPDYFPAYRAGEFQ